MRGPSEAFEGREVQRTVTILVAAPDRVLSLDPRSGRWRTGAGLGARRPTCIAADGRATGRAWCGTKEEGVFRSEDGGRSWQSTGLRGEHVTAIAASPIEEDLVWAGTEPSAVWRSEDAGSTWERSGGLSELPSASEWSFPPKPQTHHVRWIACHPTDAGRLWIAVEAGALVTTADGGETWIDRAPGGPRDTHELGVHPERPDTLRVSAGDGYFESEDGGSAWATPRAGLEVDYLRSVAIDPADPEVVLVSAASRARTAYAAGRSDGRLYRKEGTGAVWERVLDGWPEPAETIAPLLAAGSAGGEIWAADERGVHRSEDGGRRWRRVAEFESTPDHLRGLAVLPSADLTPR